MRYFVTELKPLSSIARNWLFRPNTAKKPPSNRTIMHQAQIANWGEAPKYVEVADPAAPGSDEIRLKVLAAGLHRVVLSRASGQHYTSTALPHVPGIDGVGEKEDGTKVYFSSFDTGSFSEYVNMDKRRAIPLPEGMDPTQAAGITNPAMSSWMALKTRVTNLPEGFSVLILGATSASGRVAIHLARALGAKRVVGAARNQKALDALDLDGTIVITEDPSKTDFTTLEPVDVVLDYVYGPLTLNLFNSLKPNQPVQYVQVGGLGGIEMDLPSAVLRSKNLTIRGSGPGAWSMMEVARAMPEMLNAMTSVPKQPVKVVKMEDVEKEWSASASERLVFVP